MAMRHIEIRLRWWVNLFAGITFLLGVVRIRVPMRLCKWVCERSTEYRENGGRWKPMTVDLSEEANEGR